jgi:hypothetical protein
MEKVEHNRLVGLGGNAAESPTANPEPLGLEDAAKAVVPAAAAVAAVGMVVVGGKRPLEAVEAAMWRIPEIPTHQQHQGCEQEMERLPFLTKLMAESAFS